MPEASRASGPYHLGVAAVLRANLLGPFSITLGDLSAGPWPRPSAKRLCELLLVSPGRRIGREAAYEVLFPNLAPERAANALSKALSMARSALSALGEPARELIQADRGHLWIDPKCGLEVDLDLVEDLLRTGLDTEPGTLRDDLLGRALGFSGILLEDEPYEDWAIRPRERLEWARQEARLALARDRAKGLGRSKLEVVVSSWESCLSGDPTCEEAAAALMQLYSAQQRWSLVTDTYERCRRALEELGLAMSPALEEIHLGALRASSPPPTRASATEAPRGSPAREERKLVSVLFAELASPPGLARLDPEDLREVISNALVETISQVELLGGTVTSVSGSGLAAIFGAPEAHEDDPERAIRAGYRIVSAVGSSAEGLTVRLGVESGPAVVGPIGGGGRVEYGAVGDVVAIAAALQSVARAGSVLVGPATHASTKDRFEWGPGEEVARPGESQALVGHYLQRPRPQVLGHLAGRRVAGQAALIGRDGELSMLSDSLHEALSGRGGIVIVVGEPGLGKTRLISECRKRFMAWVGAGSGRLPLWLEGRGASYASSTPYGLYQQLLSAWIGVAPEEGEEIRRPALEQAMRALFGSEEAPVGPLARMMGLGAGDDTARLARLDPEELQRATFSSLRALVSRLTAYGPTVLVLEDLHWADPTSIRLTEEVAALVGDGPLLVLLTHRPEPDPGVTALEEALANDRTLSLRRVELAPLSEADEKDLARSFLGEGAPEDVVEAVRKGVEGNPLFLEERLSSLVETGAVFRAEHLWRLDPSVRGEEVPEALERLIRSRVDRLGPEAHDVVVAASVLGVEFGLSALRAVTDLNGQLEEVVEELCAAGLLADSPRQSERAYRFRHALMQEATYKGMLRTQRRQLHARAAWTIEESASDRLEDVAAVLGHHYAAAGERHRAVHYLVMAGDHAASAFANVEAISSYREALSILAEDTPGADADWSAQVELRAKLAEVFWRTARHDESREMFHEALRLVGSEAPLLAAGLQIRLGRVEVAAHRYEAATAAFDAAEQLLGENQTGQEQEWTDLWLELQLDGRALLHYWRNEPALGMAVLETARPLVETRGRPAQKRTFYESLVMQQLRETRYRINDEILANERAALAAAEGCSEGVLGWAHFMMGFCLLWHGDLAEAREELEIVLAIAEQVGDLVLRLRALCYLNVTALRGHDTDTVRRLAPETLAAAVALSYPEYVAAATATLAWLAWQEERFEDVIALGEEALELWGTTVVAYSWYSLCLWPMIAEHLRTGHIAEAVGLSRRLLAPPQQRLPDDLESLVEAAGSAWDEKRHRVAAERLAEALELGTALGWT